MAGCEERTSETSRERIARLRARLSQEELPGAMIRDPLNVRYLSGFTGSTAVLLVTATEAVFITDSRYTAQAAAQCPGFRLAAVRSGGKYEDTICEEGNRLGVERLAVEGDTLPISQYEKLKAGMPGIALVPVSDLVRPLRQVKDGAEVEQIRAGCAILDRAFEWVLTLLRPGVTERDVALELEYFMRKNGAEKEAFDTIAASGPRSALPHGRPSERALAPGDFITLDFGARVGGYHSDITRTVVLGTADARQREVYGVVLEAQLAALAAIRPGIEGKAVDAVARSLIAARGFGDYFGHGLGHGLGLACHDHPALAPTSDLVLAAGMVVTVEPGIYIDGWGGVRIEDDVLVTDAGCEILTHARKELIELPV